MSECMHERMDGWVGGWVIECDYVCVVGGGGGARPPPPKLNVTMCVYNE